MLRHTYIGGSTTFLLFSILKYRKNDVTRGLVSCSCLVLLAKSSFSFFVLLGLILFYIALRFAMEVRKAFAGECRSTYCFYLCIDKTKVPA